MGTFIWYIDMYPILIYQHLITALFHKDYSSVITCVHFWGVTNNPYETVQWTKADKLTSETGVYGPYNIMWELVFRFEMKDFLTPRTEFMDPDIISSTVAGPRVVEANRKNWYSIYKMLMLSLLSIVALKENTYSENFVLLVYIFFWPCSNSKVNWEYSFFCAIHSFKNDKKVHIYSPDILWLQRTVQFTFLV